jgi:hypothetical protein
MSGELAHSARRHKSSATAHAGHDDAAAAVGKQTRVATDPAPPDQQVSIATLTAAGQLLSTPENRGPIYAAPKAYFGALNQLQGALVGTSVFYPAGLGRADRIALFDTAVRKLEPLARDVERNDEFARWWVEDTFRRDVGRRRAELTNAAARERVDRAILSPDHREVAEVPTGPLDDGTADKYAAALRPTMKTLHRSLGLFEKTLAHIEPDAETRHHTLGTRVGASMDALSLYLNLLETKHAWHEATTAHGAAERFTSYTELVKAALETTEQATKVATCVAGTVANLRKQPEVAAKLFGLGEHLAKGLGPVIAVIEIVHGFALISDPNANATQMLDGTMAITTGGLGVVGAVVEAPALGTASLLIGAGYMLWRLDMALHLKVRADLAIAGLAPIFNAMADDAAGIRACGDRLVKAMLLLAREPDPVQQVELSRVVVQYTEALDSAVDAFLDSCKFGDGFGARPGANPHLRKAFADLVPLRGRSASADGALQKAHRVGVRLRLVFEDAPNYVRLSMGLDRAVPE